MSISSGCFRQKLFQIASLKKLGIRFVGRKFLDGSLYGALNAEKSNLLDKIAPTLFIILTSIITENMKIVPYSFC